MCDAIAIFLVAGAAAWAAGSLVGLVYVSWRLWRHWTVTNWADEYRLAEGQIDLVQGTRRTRNQRPPARNPAPHAYDPKQFRRSRP